MHPMTYFKRRKEFLGLLNELNYTKKVVNNKIKRTKKEMDNMDKQVLMGNIR